VTVSNLLQRWIVPPSLADADVTLQVRVATMQKWAAIGNSRALHSPALIAEASIKADEFRQPNRSASRIERIVVVVMVSADPHEGVHMLPHSELKDLLVIHRSSGDFRRGLESKQWIRSVVEAGAAAPTEDIFLLGDVNTTVSGMVDAVRQAAGNAKLNEAVWERTVSEVVPLQAGPCRRARSTAEWMCATCWRWHVPRGCGAPLSTPS